MPPKKVADLIFMGSSADRSGADVALPILNNELEVSGNGVPGTGTAFYPKAAGAIKGGFVTSETAAMVELRFRKTNDNDFQKFRTTHLQTDPLRPQILNYCDYAVGSGDAIEASGENAGNVLDVLGLYMDKGDNSHVPSPVLDFELPKGARLIKCTATFTHIADSVAQGTITPEDFVFVRDQIYDIYALGIDSATGCAGRLKFRDPKGPNYNDVPGVPCADTSTGLEYMMFYGDFGSFKGQLPPLMQTVAVAADAVTNMWMIIVPR